MRLLTAFLLVMLAGCVGDQEHKDKQDNRVEMPAPTVNVTVPSVETVDADKLKAELTREIQTSSNNTQNQLSGLFNASISKIAEKVVGLEASVSANMTNTAMADLKADIRASATLTAEMNTKLDMKAELNNVMSAVADLKLSVGDLSASVKGVVAGQAGVGNKMETLQQDVKNTAGRDVSYLPKEAVEMTVKTVESANATWMYFMGGMFTLGNTLGYLAYRSSVKREHDTFKLLQLALSHVPPEKMHNIKLP